MMMDKRILLGVLVFVLFLAGCGQSGVTGSSVADSPIELFGSCLTASGATFYGAYWCPHCNAQKEMLGDGVDFVNYVECSLPERAGQTEVCKQANIQNYPTWEFGDGGRVTGTQSLQTLAQKSGCSLEG